MPKVENAPVATSRELLPIKPTAVTVNAKHHLNKEVVIDMDDSLTFQDLLNDPKLFRLDHKDRARSLCDDDRVTLRWHGQRVHTSVDYADPDQALLFKAPVLTRRERDRTPWQNDSFEVRAVAGGWSY